MASTELPTALLTFAALQPGYQAAYPVMVDGKEIVSRGEVFQIRRISKNQAEITLLHAKTGALFTNTVRASARVLVSSAAFAPMLLAPEQQDDLTRLLKTTLEAKVAEDVQAFYALPVAD